MKLIFILCGVILIIGGALIWRSLRGPTHFGTFNGAPKTEVVMLIDKPREFLKKTVVVEGIVRKQCSTMGCYFFFEEGDKLLRIDISEIAMNAPSKNGHRARVEGQIVPYQDGFQFWATAVEFE